MPEYVTKEEIKKIMDEAIKENNKIISTQLMRMHDSIIQKLQPMQNQIDTLALAHSKLFKEVKKLEKEIQSV